MRADRCSIWAAAPAACCSGCSRLVATSTASISTRRCSNGCARRRRPRAGRRFSSRPDMRDFTMPRRYRRVICPFNAFAHVETTEAQLATLACVRQHLEPDGAFVVFMSCPGHRYWSSPTRIRCWSWRRAATTRAADSDLGSAHQGSGRAASALDRRIPRAGPGRSRVIGSSRFETSVRWVYRYELELLFRLAGLRAGRSSAASAGSRSTRDDQSMIAWAWEVELDPRHRARRIRRTHVPRPPPSSPASRISTCARGSSSRASSPACTARRFTASASSSPSTARTCRAIRSRTWTGRCGRAATATSSSSTPRRRTSAATCCSTCRGSMAFRSPRAAMSKLEYAQSLAAALAYLMLHQQDAVGRDAVRRPAAPLRAAARGALRTSTCCSKTLSGGRAAGQHAARARCSTSWPSASSGAGWSCCSRISWTSPPRCCRTPALPPPQPRGDRVPHPRPRRGRVPVHGHGDVRGSRERRRA